MNVATVAARLGQADGGATLLRVYAHTTVAGDAKAAETAARPLKTPQITCLDPRRRLTTTPEDIQPRPQATRGKHLAKLPPYELIAHDIRTAINVGTLQPGDPLPPIMDLAHWYSRSVATIHRAVALLADEHVLDVHIGRRTRVATAHESGPAQSSPAIDCRGITVESPEHGEHPRPHAMPANLRGSPDGSDGSMGPSHRLGPARSTRRSPSPPPVRPDADNGESTPSIAGTHAVELTSPTAFYCEHTASASRIYALIRRANGAVELRTILTVGALDLAERACRALAGELHTPPGPAPATEIRQITRRLPEPCKAIFTLALRHARNHVWPAPRASVRQAHDAPPQMSSFHRERAGGPPCL